MTYTVLESLIGDFLMEPGSTTRYSQARRQRGIVWAELEAAKYLHEDDLYKLIKDVTFEADDFSSTSYLTNAKLVTRCAAGDSPDLFMDVIAIYLYPTNIYFKKWDRSRIRMEANKNTTGGYYWYYMNGGIQLVHGSDIDPKTDDLLNMTYKTYPASNESGFAFGAGEVCPFDGNEDNIAMGAAAYVLLQSGDPMGVELEQRFYANIGKTGGAK